MIDITPIVGRNLAMLRKHRGLTQGQLAERFSYSDKAISKWERGEALPDLNTLYELADFYGVTLDFLTHQQSDSVLKEVGENDPRTVISNKIIITSLGVVSVWTLATFLFVSDLLMGWAWQGWISFVWAVPISFFVLIAFNAAWGKKSWNFLLTIGVIWTLLIAIYVEMGLDIDAGQGWELGYLLILGIPVTAVVLLIHRYRTLKAHRKEEQEKKEGQ